jgi:ABC-type antimicrobial peptide transport system permease subunit
VHQADRVDAAADTHLEVRAHAAPPGFFALMGIPIVRGRPFEVADTQDGAAIMISADLARRLWGASDPIGRRFITTPSSRRAGTLQVVGVAEEAKAGGRGSVGDAPGIYVPTIRTTSHFLIRTQGPAEPMLPAIRSAAHREAPTLPLVSSRSLASITAEQQLTMRNVAASIGGGGLIAQFLSAIGLYSVVSFAVGQRAREIGIRTALGADRQRVVGLFMFRSMRLSLIGLTLGLTLSVLVVKVMAVVRGEDTSPATIGVAALVALVVIGVALLASWIPARRAAHVDPLVALRTE